MLARQPQNEDASESVVSQQFAWCPLLRPRIPNGVPLREDADCRVSGFIWCVSRVDGLVFVAPSPRQAKASLLALLIVQVYSKFLKLPFHFPCHRLIGKILASSSSRCSCVSQNNQPPLCAQVFPFAPCSATSKPGEKMQLCGRTLTSWRWSHGSTRRCQSQLLDHHTEHPEHR